MNMQRIAALSGVLLAVCGMHGAHAAPGFLVAAPDRGFSGNEAVRDAYAEFAQERPAELVFVTAEGTAERLDRALLALQRQDAEPLVLLPFYLSAAHPDMAQLQSWLEGKEVVSGRHFGRSAAAPAALAQRLGTIEKPSEIHLAVVGHGAETEAEAQRMQRDLKELLDWAGQGMQFASAAAHVWPNVERLGEDEFRQQVAAVGGDGNPHDTVLLPFHLGPDLDAMMGFNPRLEHAAPDDVEVLDAGAGLKSSMALWLAREAARYGTLDNQEIGVVVHAHGSNWQWNETMREGARPLAENHLVEFAFSMGDPGTLEHAVRHLEERGAKGIVILRVFGMANSFRDGIAQFIGASWESCEGAAAAGTHGSHGGHSGGTPAPFLETRLPVVTVGGLEDHPLFAEALLQRALAISEEPRDETVILVAHGVGTEDGNAHWRRVLESLREQMLDRITASGGERFRAIEVGLWSEDWPELRQSAVEHVRSLVERGNENGGRVLVIPARTLGQGPAEQYLDGLDYVLGQGFAPHPLFADWLRLMVRDGRDQLAYGAGESVSCRAAGEHGAHH